MTSPQDIVNRQKETGAALLVLIPGTVLSLLAVPVNLLLIFVGIVGSFSLDTVVDDWGTQSSGDATLYVAAMLVPPLATMSTLLARKLAQRLAVGFTVVDVLLTLPAVVAIALQLPFILRTQGILA